MIQSENIPSIHHIKDKIPVYLIKLPNTKNEEFSFENVTCIFAKENFGNPLDIKPVGIEFYKVFNHDTLFNERYDGQVVTYISIFENKPFDIEEFEKIIQALK